MATRIVGHEQVDMDCAVSMLALEFALANIAGFKGRVDFSFVPQGQTFEGITVNPRYQYEVIRRLPGTRGAYDERVYHVDCGGGLLDHHRPGCQARSSAELVEWAYDLVGRYPEWERIIQWATEADTGRLRSGCSLHRILPGLTRCGRSDLEILRFCDEALLGLLANEGPRVAAAAIPIREVGQPTALLLDQASPAVEVATVPGFGTIGLIWDQPGELGGSLRNRLEREHGVIITVSFTSFGCGILTRLPANGKKLACLRELGIVQEVRIAELGGVEAVNAAGLGNEIEAGSGAMAGWYAQEVDGRVVNLLCGSERAKAGDGERTKIPPTQILMIVSMAAQMAQGNMLAAVRALNAEYAARKGRGIDEVDANGEVAK